MNAPKKNGRPRKWTPRKILDAIIAFAQCHEGKSPSWRDFSDCIGGLPHHATVLEHFTSKDDAIRAAGLDIQAKQTKPSETHAWRILGTQYPHVGEGQSVKCRFCISYFPCDDDWSRELACKQLQKHVLSIHRHEFQSMRPIAYMIDAINKLEEQRLQWNEDY